MIVIGDSAAVRRAIDSMVLYPGMCKILDRCIFACVAAGKWKRICGYFGIKSSRILSIAAGNDGNLLRSECRPYMLRSTITRFLGNGTFSSYELNSFDAMPAWRAIWAQQPWDFKYNVIDVLYMNFKEIPVNVVKLCLKE